MRFTDPVEGHASLALRVGDTSAVVFYADHQRCEWSNYLAHFGRARSDRALAEIDSNVVGVDQATYTLAALLEDAAPRIETDSDTRAQRQQSAVPADKELCPPPPN